MADGQAGKDVEGSSHSPLEGTIFLEKTEANHEKPVRITVVYQHLGFGIYLNNFFYDNHIK